MNVYGFILSQKGYTAEYGQNVAAMCARLPMTTVRWFCRFSALCGLSLVAEPPRTRCQMESCTGTAKDRAALMQARPLTSNMMG